MAFSGGGNDCVEIGKSPDQCKPDYEAQAARMKKKLDATIALNKALENFANTNNIYDFRKISSFAEMVGGVMITMRDQTKTYESLLSHIEKET